MYEDFFNICSSFNVNLFYHDSQQAYSTLPNHFKNSLCYFYHENSFDLKNKQRQIEFEEVSNNVILIDLYKENPWLEDFIKNSTFKKLINDTNYWNRNSQFWFRKVVSIVNFINTPQNKEYGIWFDCDTYMIKNIDATFFNYIKTHDWNCYFRNNENGSIESGIQIFKLNDKTKLFAKKYLEYFLSEMVFIQEPIYADNYVLKSCFTKFGSDLKIGQLNTTNSFNIYDYVRHNKGKLLNVREQL